MHAPQNSNALSTTSASTLSQPATDSQAFPVKEGAVDPTNNEEDVDMGKSGPRPESVGILSGVLEYCVHGKKPLVSYENLPPWETSKSQSLVPHNVYRYTLHSNFPLHDLKLKDKEIMSVRNQLITWVEAAGHHKSLLDDSTVCLRAVGPLRVMDLKWPHINLTPPLSLPTFLPTVDGHQALFHDAGTKGLRHNISIQVCLSNDANIRQFVDAFNRVLAGYRAGIVIDAWAVHIRDEHTEDKGQWNGQVVMLVSLYDTSAFDDNPVPTSDPKLSASELPGFFQFAGEPISLQYLHRLPWCNFCKARADSYHMLSQCQHRKCKECHAAGHSAKDCPKASKKRDRKAAKAFAATGLVATTDSTGTSNEAQRNYHGGKTRPRKPKKGSAQSSSAPS